jgi:hypothetical protein
VNNEHKSIVGVPLLLQMIAKRHKSDKNFFESSNLFTFFEKCYIGEKWDIYDTEKGAIVKDDRKQQFKQGISPLNIHFDIALNYFFGIDFPEGSKVDESVFRLGICSIVDGTPRFTHETVAEFFLAYFLSKEIRKHEINRGTVRFLLDVLSDQKFKIVRMFLDLSLKTQGEFHKKLIEVFIPYENVERNFDTLKNSIEENNEFLVTSMTLKNNEGKSLFTLITGGEMMTKFNEAPISCILEQKTAMLQ